MKAITAILLFLAVIAAKADDTRSLKESYHLTVNLNDLEIVDLPRSNLKGSPSELFGKRTISRIIVIGNKDGMRAIVSPITQAWIDLIRSKKLLAPLDGTPPPPVIGFVILDSGKLVVIRRSATQVVVQVGMEAGALPAEAFPNMLGWVTAPLINPAGEPFVSEDDEEDEPVKPAPPRP